MEKVYASSCICVFLDKERIYRDLADNCIVRLICMGKAKPQHVFLASFVMLTVKNSIYSYWDKLRKMHCQHIFVMSGRLMACL